MSTGLKDDFSGTDRFVIQGRIGAGGMGVVYRAFDRQSQRTVALKTLRHMSPSALYRFKREFRALADLAHPNLITLYELISSGDEWFFTMELIEGVDFLTWVRSGPGEPQRNPAGADAVGEDQAAPDSGNLETETYLSTSDLSDAAPHPVGLPSGRVGKPRAPQRFDRLRSALAQLGAGLCALHEARKLHCDVKPSNVLVTTDGRVVLLDFGLVAELDRLGGGWIDDEVGGTMQFIAPERLTLESPEAERHGPAGDWYSVGIMLYLALTGQHPADAATWFETDRKASEPPSPADLVPGIPEDLNRLCVDLLRSDPGRRPSGRDVLQRLGGELGAELPATAPLSGDRLTPFVGRRAHLEALEEAFAAVKRGRTVVLRVHGRSGFGKSALLKHFVDGVKEHDRAVVLSGRCYERESVPYKALDSLVDDLCRYLMGRSRSEMDALLPHYVSALARLFPVFRTVETAVTVRGVAAVPDQQELRRRAFAALREALVRLGDRKPLILCLDDLQWGDVDSALLLREVLRPPDAPLLLLIASYRSEDAESSPFLRQLLGAAELAAPGTDQRELRVDPLTDAEARELARALLGPDKTEAETLAALAAQESRGNPYFVAELVHWWQSVRGTSERTGTDRRTTLQHVLQDRIRGLPETPRRVLEVLAVAGQPLSQEIACRAAALSATDPAALAVLRASHLVRTKGPGERDEVETYHDSIRETIVAHLSPPELKAHHRSLAGTLEAFGGGDPETLAAHFLGADDPERASVFYARAADQAADALAFDRAAALYRRALQLGAMEPARQRTLRVRLAEALSNAGRGGEAAREYRAAAQGASATERLELQRCGAMQSLISGHIDEGITALREVLQAVNLALPERPWQALVSLLLRRGWLRVRGLQPKPYDPARVSVEMLSRSDVCWSAAVGLSIVDTVRGADFQIRNLLLALQIGEPYRVARGLAWEAAHAATAGGPGRKRTEQLLRAAVSSAVGIEHPHLLGLTTLSRGIAAYMLGQWKAARELTEQANQIFCEQCTGVAWELDTAQSFLVWSLFFLGDVGELERRLPLLLKAARERGDLYAATNLGTFSGHLTWLAADDPEGARRALQETMGEWSRKGFHVQHLTGLMAQTQIDLYCGNGPAAWERLQETWPAVRRSFFLRVQTVRIFLTHLRARSALLAARQTNQPQHFLRHVERDARRIERERMPWAVPMAQLLRAGIAAARDRAAPCASLLLAAERGFADADMGLFAASVQRRRGERIGGDDGRRLIADADARMSAQGIRNPARMTALHFPVGPEANDLHHVYRGPPGRSY